MKTEDMKIHYVVLVDGTELIGKSTGRGWTGTVKIVEPCIIIRDDYENSIASVRRWMRWAEDPSKPVELSHYSIVTCFPVNEAIAEQYVIALDNITKTNEKLDAIQSNDIDDEPSIDEFISEFLAKKGTLH